MPMTQVNPPVQCRLTTPSSQRGIVLMMALIMLVALTLAGLSLMRSVDTSNIIAGNLGFKLAATSAADLASERAITALNAGSFELTADSPANGYFAARADPVDGRWDTFFALLETANNVRSAGTDSLGNNLAYVVHRLCRQVGASTTPGVYCAVQQAAPESSEGSSQGGGTQGLNRPSAIYYRITTKVTGPRNTVSFTQSVIAL